jgi:hypothetical protein
MVNKRRNYNAPFGKSPGNYCLFCEAKLKRFHPIYCADIIVARDWETRRLAGFVHENCQDWDSKGSDEVHL